VGIAIVSVGVFEVRHIGFSKYEQRLSERATEALKKMTELKQLRELLRLAEATGRAGYFFAVRSIRKSPIRLPDFNCATSQRGRLPRPDQVSEG